MRARTVCAYVYIYGLQENRVCARTLTGKYVPRERREKRGKCRWERRGGIARRWWEREIRGGGCAPVAVAAVSLPAAAAAAATTTTAQQSRGGPGGSFNRQLAPRTLDGGGAVTFSYNILSVRDSARVYTRG